MSAVTTDLSYRARLMSLQQQTLQRTPQKRDNADSALAQAVPANQAGAARDVPAEASKVVEEARKGILHIIA